MVANNPISIDELQPGMMIVKIEEQNGPVKLRKSGIVKSEDMVKGLKEMGVLTLIIDWENSLELDDTPTLTTPTNTVVQTNTRQLFNVQEQSYNNAISDQFNRSLFLPSLQALPSQFSVWSRYAVQYIGVSVIGLGIGFGLEQLWNQHLDDTNTANTVITTPPPSSTEPLTPIKTPDAEKSTMAKASLEPTDMATDIEENNGPTDMDDVDDVDDVDDIDNSTLVTQRADDNISTSPIIAAKVNEALAQLGGLETLTQTIADDAKSGSVSRRPEERETTVEVVDNIPRISELPERILVQLPAMVFSAHMYSSDDQERWVRVNNRRLQEGDSIDKNVSIVKIEPQFVVLSFSDTQFKMNALTDW